LPALELEAAMRQLGESRGAGQRVERPQLRRRGERQAVVLLRRLECAVVVEPDD